MILPSQLRPDASDGTVECLHFRHEHVIAVRGLGGHCYRMDDDIENEDHADDGEPTKIGERVWFPFIGSLCDYPPFNGTRTSSVMQCPTTGHNPLFMDFTFGSPIHTLTFPFGPAC